MQRTSGAGTTNLSGTSDFIPRFTGVRVAQSLIGAFVIIIVQELILKVENPRV